MGFSHNYKGFLMDWLLFVSNFLMASFLPGINMTLALNYGILIGYKKTLFMISGSVLALGIVAFLSATSIGIIIIKKPFIFEIIKVCGGIYILYLAFKIFISTSKIKDSKVTYILNAKELFMQGFIACITNPKAWIFLAALLPPFLDKSNPFNAKMFLLIFIILCIEFFSFSVYALGGTFLKKFITKYISIVQKLSTILLSIVALWMIFW